MQILLRHLPDPRHLAHVERRQERRLAPGNHRQNAVRLRLIGRDLRDQPRDRNPDRAVQLRGGLHPLVQQVRRAQRRPVQPLGAAHIEIRLVDRRHLDERRERSQHFVHLVRALAVPLGMAIDEDRLRAQLVRGAQRHRRMHAELPRRIGRRRDHPALVRPSADHDRLAFQRRVEQLFHGHEERVHVDMEVSLHSIPVFRSRIDKHPASSTARIRSIRFVHGNSRCCGRREFHRCAIPGTRAAHRRMLQFVTFEAAEWGVGIIPSRSARMKDNMTMRRAFALLVFAARLSSQPRSRLRT